MCARVYGARDGPGGRGKGGSLPCVRMYERSIALCARIRARQTHTSSVPLDAPLPSVSLCVIGHSFFPFPALETPPLSVEAFLGPKSG